MVSFHLFWGEVWIMPTPGFVQSHRKKWCNVYLFQLQCTHLPACSVASRHVQSAKIGRFVSSVTQRGALGGRGYQDFLASLPRLDNKSCWRTINSDISCTENQANKQKQGCNPLNVKAEKKYNHLNCFWSWLSQHSKWLSHFNEEFDAETRKHRKVATRVQVSQAQRCEKRLRGTAR